MDSLQNKLEKILNLFFNARCVDTKKIPKVRGLPIYTTGIIGQLGQFLFSFDKETIYNYWRDYPADLTKEQIAIFDKAFPFWADYRKQ